MLNTKILAPIVAVAAIGGYAVYQNNDKSKTTDPMNTDPINMMQQLPGDSPMRQASHMNHQSVAANSYQPATNFESVLRFDVYPNWVKSRWSRISTAPQQPGLSGMRVALVTGTRPSDLTGALTYYFDDTHRVQKIEFAGLTNDASALVSLFTNRYGFKTQKSLDAGYYLVGKKRNPQGLMKLTHPTTIQPHRSGQVGVYFEIRAPKSKFPLGPRSQAIIYSEKSENRFN